MTNAYEKFIFNDLPKSWVVNGKDKYDQDYQKDELINQAVSEHLNSIISEQEDENSSGEDQEQISIPEIDIDQIKLESYNKGLDDAKLKYEEIIANLHGDNDFSDLINKKLQEISSEQKLDGAITGLSMQIIEIIAKKIHLILPTDFEIIIRNELLGKLKKYYKEGEIILTINPARYDMCMNILKSEKLDNKLMDKFQVTTDEKIDVNDCKLKWQDTTLEYNKEQLSTEIDKILEQLKNSR